MTKFLRLLNFEMNRFLKFVLPAAIAFIILQVVATISAVNSYNAQVNEILTSKPEDLNNVINMLGKFSFQNITASSFYGLSFALVIILFVFYSFFTWYRDWLGKNTFAYRLLMLPIDRLNIFFTKALVFIIAGLFFFGLQYLLFYGLGFIAQHTIANQFLLNLDMQNPFSDYLAILPLLFPKTMTEFFATYGFAFGALLALFTGIIIERSYHLKGIFFSLVYFFGYFVCYVLLRTLPLISVGSFTWTPSRIFIAQQVYVVLTLVLSSVLSGYLLRHKINI